MASNWEERLRPQNATGKMSNRFDYIYPPPANFAKESEKLKREGNDCLQRPTTTGQDSKTKKQIQGVSGSFIALCALLWPWKTQQTYSCLLLHK